METHLPPCAVLRFIYRIAQNTKIVNRNSYILEARAHTRRNTELSILLDGKLFLVARHVHKMRSETL